jgi:uncharacterized Zn-binding protein involved in type VI secretion
MGFLLHVGATVICSHGGQALPTAPNPRVKVSSQPIVTQSAPYTVAGCPFATPGGPLPCVTAQWVTGAVRVKADGMPVLLQESQAITAPNGVPLNVLVTQPRVKGL